MIKFCVLPGQPPVRLDSLDGHIIIIGEEPREVPEMFIDRARAAGCQSEEDINALKQRLFSGDSAIASEMKTAMIDMFVSGNPADYLSEDDLAKLKKRLLGNLPDLAGELPTITTNIGQPSLVNLGGDEKDWPPLPGQPSIVDPDRAEKIKAAVIELINAGNPNDFTGSGSPKVETLKEKLGFEVTGPERDTAYEAAKG